MEVSVTALFYVVCKSFHIAEITLGENTLILGFLFFFFPPIHHLEESIMQWSTSL